MFSTKRMKASTVLAKRVRLAQIFTYFVVFANIVNCQEKSFGIRFWEFMMEKRTDWVRMCPRSHSPSTPGLVHMRCSSGHIHLEQFFLLDFGLAEIDFHLLLLGLVHTRCCSGHIHLQQFFLLGFGQAEIVHPSPSSQALER